METPYKDLELAQELKDNRIKNSQILELENKLKEIENKIYELTKKDDFELNEYSKFKIELWKFCLFKEEQIKKRIVDCKTAQENIKSWCIEYKHL